MKLLLTAALAATLAGGAAYAGDMGSVHGGAHSLIDAARMGEHDMVVGMLRSKADVTATSPDGSTALLWAVHNGDADLVKRLLKAGADVKAVNDFGATPMSEAAIIADPQIIKLLLKAGADPNEANATGQTPLMSVVRTSNVEAAEELIKAGADVNAREKDKNETALMMAAGQSQPAMVSLLLKHGADADARSKVNDWERWVSAEGRVQNKPSGGLTPMLYAARAGCADCAKALVEGGAKIDLTDPDNISPLLMATLNARWDTAAYLVKAGADVNKWDWWGRAPLYSTVDYTTVPRGGRTDRPSLDKTKPRELTKMLLAAGANPNMQLKLFPPYRSLGADRGGDGVLTVGSTPLLRAAKAGDYESVRILLDGGAMPDLPQSQGVTPLMVASGIGFAITDTRGRFVKEADCIKVMGMLLDAGANINLADHLGRTALHGVAEKGWSDAAKFLAVRGADLMAKTAAGKTPLDYALGDLGNVGRFRRAAEPHPDTADTIRALMKSEQLSMN